VEGNARLTSGVAVVIFVMLAIEGFTILSLGSMLNLHVFIGVALIPPVLVKISTTGWRFIRYYRGDPDYTKKGPPPIILRLLGPFVVVLTGVVIASGVVLIYTHSARNFVFFVHKASFILWLGAMTIHVLGHVLETARVAPRDWVSRSRRQVSGATTRQWVLVASVALGLVAGLAVMPHAANWWH
jgi:hypothetical protein